MLVVTVLNIIVVSMAYLARDEKHRYLLAWAFALLAIVLGLRYGYGNDFFSYKYMFDHGYPERGDEEGLEPGWRLLNHIFRPLGFSSMVFFITVIEHLMIYDIIRRYVSPNYYWLALFIYLFNPWFMLIGLSMMRQFLVQILGFYAMDFAYKKKLFHFVLIVLIAISIHKIALLLIPLCLFPYISKWFSNSFLPLIVLLIVFIVVIKRDVIIDNLIIFFTETDMSYGDSYLSESALSEEHRINPKLIVRYLIYIVLLIRNLKFLSVSDSSRLFAIEVTLGLLFFPFATISPMAIRTSWIYSIVMIVSMPLLLQYEKLPQIKYGAIFLLFLILLREYQTHFISDIYGAYYAHYYTVFSYYAINDIRLF